MNDKGRQAGRPSLSPPGQTMSLRWRLVALLGGVLLVSLLVIGLGVTFFTATSEQQAWRGRQQEAARYAGERVASFIQLVQDSLNLVGLWQPDALEAEPEVIDDVLAQIPALLEIIRLDGRGHVMARASRDAPVLANLFTIPQSTWFLEAKAGKPYLGGVEISTTKEPYLILASPAADGGVVAGRLSMNVLWDVVAEIKFGEEGQAYVVNQDGQIIAHQDPDVALTRTSLEGRPEMAALSEAPGNEWSGTYENFEGIQVVGVTAPVAKTDWVVITELPRAEAWAASRTALLLLGGGLLALGAVVALGTNEFLRRLIVQPMDKLSTGAMRFGRGELSHRIDIDRQDEVGQLASALNHMAGQLQNLYHELTLRSHELVRRARYLEATHVVARDAASQLDPQELLSRVVQLISEQFGFYHTGLFLLDGEWAVLQAASSEGGQRMLARGHRLRTGVGIVGYVVAHGEHRVALDVGEDAVFFDNPDLPQTRSEMALPLRARGEIIGVLDVQSTEAGAFSEEDVTVLQTLADGVAVAISNARLFQRVQESLEAERRAYGELGRRAWQQLLRGQTDLGYVRDNSGISPAVGRWQPEAERALQTGEAVQGANGENNLAVPIELHGRIVGVIDAYKPVNAGGWTSEQVSLLKTLSSQLGVALDSARLYEDAQRRSAEDRLVGEITARIRETLDVDVVLQTAVREMARALGIPRVEVRLGGVAQTRDGQSQVVTSSPRLARADTSRTDTPRMGASEGE
jgi:GAF domain-containing protein/HAMP domain-containing protein